MPGWASFGYDVPQITVIPIFSGNFWRFSGLLDFNIHCNIPFLVEILQFSSDVILGGKSTSYHVKTDPPVYETNQQQLISQYFWW
jgi:hypothetical protein